MSNIDKENFKTIVKPTLDDLSCGNLKRLFNETRSIAFKLCDM
jgi:hypothetical protein